MIPRRACAYCFRRYQISWIEDEWHILFVCPMYSFQRRSLPFTGPQLCVEGHPMQGTGCVPRNLVSMMKHIMSLPSLDVIVDFMVPAMKLRRDSRRTTFPFQ